MITKDDKLSELMDEYLQAKAKGQDTEVLLIADEIIDYLADVLVY